MRDLLQKFLDHEISRREFGAGLTALGSSFAAGSEWPDVIPELLERDDLLSFPVVRLTVTTAVILVARPSAVSFPVVVVMPWR